MKMKLPYSDEIEQTLLGTLLIEPYQFIKASEIIKHNFFYSEKHKQIYIAIKDLFDSSYSIDLISVSEQLKKNGMLEISGGLSYLSDLLNKSTYDIEYHCKILAQKFMQRQMIITAHKILKDANDDTKDIFELIDETNNTLLESQNIIDDKTIKPLNEIKNRLLKTVIDVRTGNVKSNEIISCVDFIKFYKNTVTVIGAKPATGKTAFMLTSAEKQAKKGYKVMLVSLEMTTDRIVARMLQSKTEVYAKRLIAGEITDEEYDNIKNTDLSDKIYIDEGIGWTSNNFKSNLIRLYKKYNFDMIYVDYFQKIPLIGKDTVVNMQFYLMENQICSFAKEYPVAVCLLSQLTRGSDKGMEGLRGGGIEQGAQQVYIFSDEYLDENKNVDWHRIPEDRRGKIAVTCEKNRDDSNTGGYIYFDKVMQTMTYWSMETNQQKITTIF